MTSKTRQQMNNSLNEKDDWKSSENQTCSKIQIQRPW